MKIVKSIAEMKKISHKIHSSSLKIGFVPTMGFLHEGHLSLIKIAKKMSERTVVSIFVNPTQFGPNEDYYQYPRDIKRDKELLKKEGVHYIFYPSEEEMYPEGFLTTVKVKKLSEILCGASRPVHFEGVTTVVLKLFNIINPDIAVFGEKDYQQLVIIKKMVMDLNLDISIVSGEIIREQDGIAMSSRNTYLSKEERKQATCLYRSLLIARDWIMAGERNTSIIISRMKEFIKTFPSTKIDYIEIVDPETLNPLKRIKGSARILLAVWIGKTRLIDNLQVNV